MACLSYRAGLRLAPWIIFVLLPGCASRPVNPQALYLHSSELRKAGKIAEARAETDKGLEQAPAGSPLWWNFYLQKIQIVQQTDGAKASMVLFDREPPETPGFRIAKARRKLYLAWALLTQSNEAGADVASSEALETARPADDLALIARIEFFRVSLLSSLHRTGEAEQLRALAEEHARASQDRDVSIYGLAISSMLLFEEGRFEEALDTLEQRLALVRQTNSGSGMAHIYLDIGWSRFRLGQVDQALEALRTAEKVSRELEDKSTLGTVLGDMGDIYLSRRQYDLARQSCQGAFQIASESGEKKMAARWLSNLARIATELRDWPQANEINQRALRLKEEAGDENAQRYSFVIAARILDGQGRAGEAEKLFQRIAGQRWADPIPSLEAGSYLAQLYARTGQDAKATGAFEAALRSVEHAGAALKQEDSKINFLASLMEVYDNYIDFLMAKGRTGRALEVAEASRARILQEKTGEESEGGGQAVGVDRYRMLARETGAILLSYWLGPKRSYVWVTTGENIAFYWLPARDKIGALVERYRLLIEGLEDPLTSDDGAGRELYDGVLASVIDRIPAGSHVIVAPGNALNALNFETIPVPSPAAHYFIEDAVISVAPSLNMLALAGRKQSDGSAKLLLIGDPNPPEPAYGKLPYAAEEIDAVKAHFAPSGVLSFRKNEASPSAYQTHAAESPDYVHFTAHASSDSQNPLESAIILSGPLGANRLLARDVARNKNPARLVTISACRGAGAKTYAGEGLVGFMWAFFRAGARSIIAGLWDVSDESTPQLMDRLYGGLARGVPVADALRDAKLSLAQSGGTYQLPYYWGPFQLYIREAPATGTPAKLIGKIAQNAQDRNGEVAGQVFKASGVRSVGGRPGGYPGRVHPLSGPAEHLR